ncbi:DUF4157 domain-containing protein [Methanolobus sp. ZRKC3]|uniref:eCIS core domain-containing protein n=1 Tax=Methanolobus sp. ZRKC3 TaxID=3125786 RepID=UPI00324B50C8
MPEHEQAPKSKKTSSNIQREAKTSKQTDQTHPADITPNAQLDPGSLAPADILQLQRTVGNQAVGRLLRSGQVVQRQGPEEEEELLQGKFDETIQRQEVPEEEEEELLQGKFDETIQKQEPEEEEELLQGKFDETIQKQEPEEEEELLQGRFKSNPEQATCFSCSTASVQREEENRTGMPDNLKAGLEQLSDMDLSDVHVHRNSTKPEQLNALAYTQGQDIHLGPGQEKHLPHEGWHAVQQKQERVKPTMQGKGVAINDDAGLEREADVMGGKAMQMKRPNEENSNVMKRTPQYFIRTAQSLPKDDLSKLVSHSVSPNVLQRRILIKFNLKNIATTFQITGRPSWRSVATKAHPSAKGCDRRHILAWYVIKKDIKSNIFQKDKYTIRAFLTNPSNFKNQKWATESILKINKFLHSSRKDKWEKAIQYYASARFNDPGNLFMGPRMPNRALGCRIRPAYNNLLKLLTEWNKKGLDKPLPNYYYVTFPFTDIKTGEVQKDTIPILTIEDVVDWYGNMVIDWEKYEDWSETADIFIRHLEGINPVLAKKMVEASTAW